MGADDHTQFASFSSRPQEWLKEEERRVSAHLRALQAHGRMIATSSDSSLIPSPPTIDNIPGSGSWESSRHLAPHRRAEIAQAESTLLRQAAHLRSQMNACVHACSLPDELLRKVFVQFTVDYAQEHYTLAQTLRLTHVCRYWRDVAIAFHALWTHVDYLDSTISSVLMPRTKMAPISLEWRRGFASSYVDRDDALEFLHQLAPVTNRVVRLTVDDSSSDRLFSIFPSFFQRNAWNSVQFLKLSQKHSHSRIFGYLEVDFRGNSLGLSNLRHLALHSIVPSNWDLYTVAPNLHTLHLSGYQHDGVQPSLSQVLNLLASCNVLQELKMERCPPKPGSSHGVESSRTVDMRDLKALELELPHATDIADILRHLLIPGSTSIALTVLERFAAPLDHPVTLMSSKSLEWVTTTVEATAKLLSIHIATRSGAAEIPIMLGFFEPLLFDHLHPRVAPFKLAFPSWERAGILFNLCSQIAHRLHTITHLSLHAQLTDIIDTSTEYWVEALSGLASLKSLHFRQAFIADPDGPWFENRPIALIQLVRAIARPILPALESFHLIDIHPTVLQIVGDNIEHCISFRSSAEGQAPFRIVALPCW